MDPYTSLTLPYFAPADTLPAPLPTFEQVLASTTFLKRPVRGTEEGECELIVARVGEHFIAKYGKCAMAIEGENMLFVKSHTSIPVPRVYAIYNYGEGKTMLIMEYVAGALLRDYRAAASTEKVRAVWEMIENQLNELRRIPAPDFFGSLGRRPFYRTCEADSAHGPYSSVVEAAVEIMFELPEDVRHTERFDRIRRAFAEGFGSVAENLGHAAPVFTHGFVHGANVVVRDDGVPVMYGYDSAGFYPAFLEHYRFHSSGRRYDSLSEGFTEECLITLKFREAWVEAEEDEWRSDEGFASDGDPFSDFDSEDDEEEVADV